MLARVILLVGAAPYALSDGDASGLALRLRRARRGEATARALERAVSDRGGRVLLPDDERDAVADALAGWSRDGAAAGFGPPLAAMEAALAATRRAPRAPGP